MLTSADIQAYTDPENISVADSLWPEINIVRVRLSRQSRLSIVR
jgi:hypothetical protein